MSEPETQKDLIVRFKIEQGKKGPIARLWRKGDQHPEFLVFDVSDLTEAGIDWQACDHGTEHPSRFWCIWHYSDKSKTSGNPYKDVLRLEPYQTSTSPESNQFDTILAELRAMKTLLAHIAEPDPVGAPVSAPVTGPAPNPVGAPICASVPKRSGADSAPPEDLDEALFGPDDPSPPSPSPNGANAVHTEPATEASRSAGGVNEAPAEEQFEALITHAIANQTIPADTINEIAAAIKRTANGHGWPLAIEALQTELARHQKWTTDQITRRNKVVERAQALLNDPRVEQNAIQHTFKPGWQWIYSYNQIIQYGKRLKAQLDARESEPAPIHL